MIVIGYILYGMAWFFSIMIIMLYNAIGSALEDRGIPHFLTKFYERKGPLHSISIPDNIQGLIAVHCLILFASTMCFIGTQNFLSVLLYPALWSVIGLIIGTVAILCWLYDKLVEFIGRVI